jgi:cobyrinic acid a,c-diamide synthase
MRIEAPRLVIAAPASGCGKSTITSGLMAATVRRGLRVQGYKVGPDYIDPGYHTAATGRAARNLDTWMVPADRVLGIFGRAMEGADLAIVEGVMGLFDGYGGKDDAGSTAEVARLLSAPVILVLDVRRMARSAAAMALGYREFDRRLNVAGVICNNVASPRHAAWVTEAIDDIGLPVLGCIPRQPELRIPERHLGLHTAVERTAEVEAFLEHAAEIVTRYVDLDRLLAIAHRSPALDISHPTLASGSNGHWSPAVRPSKERAGLPLAVARDEAFCFYYADNFDLLRSAGAEIVFFSPLRATHLPKGCAGLYLGGGYPELYADQLAGNQPLMQAVRAAAGSGMPVYAECGGLMYLTHSLRDLAGVEHPMAGVLPGQSRMCEQLTMGYRMATARRDSVLLACGDQVRGHEFHYSDWIGFPDQRRSAAYDVVRHTGEEPWAEGYAVGNVLASYIHLHLASRPGMAERWVAACRVYQRSHTATQEGSGHG